MASYLEPLGSQEVNKKETENGNIVRDQKERSGGMIDIGMGVVIFIIIAMILIVFFVLFTVKHGVRSYSRRTTKKRRPVLCFNCSLYFDGRKFTVKTKHNPAST